jgi:hypothetical protein
MLFENGVLMGLWVPTLIHEILQASVNLKVGLNLSLRANPLTLQIL